jgi:transposase
MLYVGMDVHKDLTVLNIFDPAAEPRRQHRLVTAPTTREGLESALRPLAGQCKVAYEVGLQAQWVADIVRPLAVEVQVANPSRIPWLFRDGRKNDSIDARKLATLLYLDQLPRVHLPRAEVSSWRSLINSRRGVIKRRTMVKNQIRSILRAGMLRCPHRSLWTRRGLAWLKEQPLEAARAGMVRRLLNELEMLEANLADLEQDLDRIAQGQPAVAHLRTIPGIGPRCAEAVVAYADDVRRFGRGRQFASYFGMTPTQDASGLVNRYGHISKRGPSVVRWVLVEAAHQVVRHCAVVRAFCQRIWRGKKDRYKKAIVATGRKLLTVMFAMLRDQTPFDPVRWVRPAA